MSRQDLRQLSELVTKELVSVEMAGENAIISMPVLYPSGSSAVVNVSQHGERYFVSDLGYGFQEAEMCGASSAFHRLAEKKEMKFHNRPSAIELQRSDNG